MRCRYRIRACEYLAAVNNAGITCRKAPVLPQGLRLSADYTTIIHFHGREGQVEGGLGESSVLREQLAIRLVRAVLLQMP